MYGANVQRFRRSVKEISNRQRMKAADAAIAAGNKAIMILFAVLAQKGGEVVVTDGTLMQVGMNLANLDYAIVDGKEQGEHIVRLVEGKNNGGSDQEQDHVDAGELGAAGTEVPSDSGGDTNTDSGVAGSPVAAAERFDVAGSDGIGDSVAGS